MNLLTQVSANINQETGIRFGIISAFTLHYDIVDTLMFGFQSTNHSYQSWYDEQVNENAIKWADGDTDAIDPDDFENYINSDEYISYEEIVSGEYEGVQYQSAWLGGALYFFISFSPIIVRANVCSPCVPNAGDLDNLDDDGVECYGVPDDWLAGNE